MYPAALGKSIEDCQQFGEVLFFHAENTPHKIIYEYLSGNSTSETISYTQLYSRALEIANELREVTKPGDRVLLLHPPGLDFICHLFACFHAGLIAVPAYPPQNDAQEKRCHLIMNDCKPSLVLPKTAMSGKDMKKFPLGNLRNNWRRFRRKKSSAWPAITKDSIAMIQYTSGSTANPKGVVLTHENLIENCKIIVNITGINGEANGVSWLPPYHDMGLIGSVLAPLYASCSATLMSPLHFLRKPYLWLKTIADKQAMITIAPNFAYDYCVNKISEQQKQTLDLRCWKVAINGAEPINPNTIKNFSHAFSVCGFRESVFLPCYGLAEATLMVSCLSLGEKPRYIYLDANEYRKNHIRFVVESEPNAFGLVSTGKPRQKVSIVDPNTLEIKSEDIIGEIWVSGSSVAKGYWEKSEDTNQVFKAMIRNSSANKDDKKRQYLRTGDLGFMHEGHLYIAGRQKDMIIIHGMNYYPQDIEHTAQESIKHFVSASCVAFSINTVDNSQEGLVIVCALPKRDTITFLEKTAHRISLEIKKTYKIAPILIAIVSRKSIPKTTSGKLQRQHTKQLLLDTQLTIWYQYQPSDISDKLSKEYLIEKIGCSKEVFLKMPTKDKVAVLITVIETIGNLDTKVKMTGKTTLAEVGLTSFEQVQLMLALEQLFEVELKQDLFSQRSTFDDVISILSTSRKEEVVPKEFFDEPFVSHINLHYLQLKWYWLKEKFSWMKWSMQGYFTIKLLQPLSYKAGSIFHSVLSMRDFIDVSSKQRKQLAIDNYLSVYRSHVISRMPKQRAMLFNGKNCFPHTWYRLNKLLKDSPKPSILMCFHMAGWDPLLFLLILCVLSTKNDKLTIIINSHFDNTQYVTGEFIRFYGKPWNEIDAHKQINILDIWDKDIGFKLQRAIKHKHKIIVFPDAIATISGKGEPVNIPLLNHHISIATGILKIASVNGVPLISLLHHLQGFALRFQSLPAVYLNSKDIANEHLTNSVSKLMKPLMDHLEQHITQWLQWRKYQISETSNVEKINFKTSTANVDDICVCIEEGNNVLILHPNTARIAQVNKAIFPFLKTIPSEDELMAILDHHQIDYQRKDLLSVLEIIKGMGSE